MLLVETAIRPIKQLDEKSTLLLGESLVSLGRTDCPALRQKLREAAMLCQPTLQLIAELHMPVSPHLQRHMHMLAAYSARCAAPRLLATMCDHRGVRLQPIRSIWLQRPLNLQSRARGHVRSYTRMQLQRHTRLLRP